MLRHVFLGIAVGLFASGTTFGQGALSLDGTDDWVDLSPGAAGVFPSGSAPFTIEAWINPDVHSNNMITFWGNQSSNQANGFRLLSGNQGRHFFWGNDDDEALGSDLSLNTGGPNNDGWHHLGITYDGNQTQWYLDGSAIGTPEVAGAVGVVDANHRIGNRLNAEFFDGLIDEVRVWDVARSSGDIAGDWNLELAGTETGLVAYYQFNGDLSDIAGNADGTAQGGALIDTAANAPVQAVPEPTSIALWVLLGSAGLFFARRRMGRE